MTSLDLNMHLVSPNPVLRQAAADRAPHLVWLNEGLIRSTPRPEGAGAIQSTLASTPMAGRPLVFTAYLLAMTSLNFQFWSLNPAGGLVRYGLDGKVGALAMQDAFLAAWLRHFATDISDESAVLNAALGLRRECAEKGLTHIFGDIPAKDERMEILQEVLNPARLLSVVSCLVARAAHEDELGWPDAQLVASLFPTAYADPYLKKAQLALMFIAAEWRARPLAKPVRLDVTAAADYQLPKVLRSLGLIGYSPEAEAAVDTGRPVHQGTSLERAVRSATVEACALLADAWGTSIEDVDFWLWQQRNVARDAKFHLTETTHY